MLSREGSLQRDSLTRDRLRFRPLTRADWAWSIGTLAAIGLMAAGGLVVIERVYGDVPVGPSFTHLEPLTPDRY